MERAAADLRRRGKIRKALPCCLVVWEVTKQKRLDSLVGPLSEMASKPPSPILSEAKPHLGLKWSRSNLTSSSPLQGVVTDGEIGCDAGAWGEGWAGLTHHIHGGGGAEHEEKARERAESRRWALWLNNEGRLFWQHELCRPV